MTDQQTNNERPDSRKIIELGIKDKTRTKIVHKKRSCNNVNNDKLLMETYCYKFNKLL